MKEKQLVTQGTLNVGLTQVTCDALNVGVKLITQGTLNVGATQVK